MAAIDRLYLKDYNDLDNLRRLALIYYPKLFIYFYDAALTINYSDFATYKIRTAKKDKQHFEDQWKEYSPDGTINGAIANLMSIYCMNEEDARWNAEYAYEEYKKSLEQLEEETSLHIMNTPFKVDKKLKWICPLPCIREYLKNQCGVKEHWYYKIFWRGKKHFML